MKILGIDPGTTKSGVVSWDTVTGKVEGWVMTNEEVLTIPAERPAICGVIAIEMISSMGMRVGYDVFETCVWVGRFWQEFHAEGYHVHRVKRVECLKHHVEGKDRNDSVMRHSLIARFGGEAVAIGGKKCKTCKGKGWCGTGRPTCTECNGDKWETPPGPLKEISSHMWPALGVALYAEDHKLK